MIGVLFMGVLLGQWLASIGVILLAVAWIIYAFVQRRRARSSKTQNSTVPAGAPRSLGSE
ncbi:hypothetical protein [Microbacterium deminutum]|uniref:hypothetical protein n=1 Tax=Microbacterium deminutum TaxID=344164 RepID=UPI0031D52F76